MKFGCMSCAAKYDVPDERVRAAGPSGLRIRCTRCRAIMVVAEGAASAVVGANREDGDVTQQLLPPPRPAAAFGAGLTAVAPSGSLASAEVAMMGAGGSTSGALTSASMSLAPVLEVTDGDAADPDAPAALSASGVFRPIAGVQRQVTGFFFPDLEELKGDARQLASSRLWYAAIDNRPRGPFAASEMIELADKGKIRDATLVWRPGYAAWRRVRQSGETGSPEDLTWLRKPVLARKLREIEAQERLQSVGIPSVNLTRTSAGGRPSTWTGGVDGLPPALPAGGSGVAPWNGGLIDGDAVTDGSSELLPFSWRVDDLPPRPSDRLQGGRVQAALMGAAVVLVLVVVAAATALVVRHSAQSTDTPGAPATASP